MYSSQDSFWPFRLQFKYPLPSESPALTTLSLITISPKRNSGIVLTFSLSFIDLIHVYSSAYRFVGSVTIFSQLESKLCERPISISPPVPRIVLGCSKNPVNISWVYCENSSKTARHQLLQKRNPVRLLSFWQRCLIFFIRLPRWL